MLEWNNTVTLKSALAALFLAAILSFGASRVIASCCGDYSISEGVPYQCEQSKPPYCIGGYCTTFTCTSGGMLHPTYTRCPMGCGAPCVDLIGGDGCCAVLV